MALMSHLATIMASTPEGLPRSRQRAGMVLRFQRGSRGRTGLTDAGQESRKRRLILACSSRCKVGVGQVG